MRFLILLLLSCSVVTTSNTVEMFNQNNFAGWTKDLGGDAGYFYIKDKVIVGKLVSSYTVKSSTFLVSKERYKNFDFQLEFFAPIFRTSILFRANPIFFSMSGKRVVDYIGYAYHIDPVGEKTGYVYLRKKNNSIIQDKILEAKKSEDEGVVEKAMIKKDDWNSIRIRTFAGKIETWLNGVLVSSLRNSDIPSGFIALELPIALNSKEFGSQIKFRNISIKKVLQ